MREYNIINVINLPERTDRLEGFLKESDREGFGVRVWEGMIIRGNNKMAINKSHKQIVQYAKDNGLLSVTIAEDDCRMFGDGGAWKYYLSQIPEQYDIFFSMYYAADSIEGNRITGNFSGMTLYTVHNSFYDVFLSRPDDIHIDRNMLGDIAKDYKFIFCDKVIAEQCGGKSNNTQTTVASYRPFLVGRKIFGDVKID